MKRAVFYISGHGFGHASRSCEVIDALYALCRRRGKEKEIRIEVCSSAAAWYFEETLGCPFGLRPVGLDIGAVQTDSLTLDARATLAAYAELIVDKEETAAREAAFLSGADLVFGDIPPMAFAAARRAGVDSIAMGNFSWDWIYEPYSRDFPEFAHVVADIRADYALAGLLLELPFARGMDAFCARRQIPLVCRPSTLSRADVRARLGLDARGRYALLSFGGIGLGRDFFRGLEDVRGWTFLCSEAGAGFSSAVVQNIGRARLAAAGLRYQDLVRGADVVITKPGYGIVSECIANRVPMLYTSRGNFREYEELVGVIKEYLPSSRFVSNAALGRGAVAAELDCAAADGAPAPDAPALDGAQVAAEAVMAALGL